MTPERRELILPPPPERPDCCGGGCAICVLEDYAELMQRWREECERLQADIPPSPDRHR